MSDYDNDDDNYNNDDAYIETCLMYAQLPNEIFNTSNSSIDLIICGHKKNNTEKNVMFENIHDFIQPEDESIVFPNVSQN